jgi:hypothetical protein
MAWQRQQYHASVAKHVALTVNHIERCFLLPFCREIALRLCARRAGSLNFVAMNDEGRPLEEAIAAAMIGM